MALVELTDRGLFCPRGEFYVDPWSPVDRAVITHSHGDHLRWGSRRYLTTASNVSILRVRVGDVDVTGLEFGERQTVGDVQVSFHPAGHILGSAQVRIEHRGEVCVVSGDYKLEADPTCPTFEPVRCRHFITEATFALPVYRWIEPAAVMREIDAWWLANQQEKRTSVLFAYALGKAERLLAGLVERHGPILVHGALQRLLPAYRAAGIDLPEVAHASAESVKKAEGQALVVAPPSAMGSPWLRKFGPISTGSASGWMRVRGARRRRGVDRGFVLSDHADWSGLCRAIEATQCEELWVTHGFTEPFARYWVERGLNAKPIATRFEGETADEGEAEPSAEAAAIPASDVAAPIQATLPFDSSLPASS